MFKTCPKCDQGWDSQNDFLADSEIELVGYQPHFEDLTTGLLMFNHSCGTTLALRVDSFSGLVDGPVFSERMMGTDACPGFCNHKSNLKPCPAQCECAYVRSLLQIIKRKLKQ
jgi:hypothetical protein